MSRLRAHLHPPLPDLWRAPAARPRPVPQMLTTGDTSEARNGPHDIPTRRDAARALGGLSRVQSPLRPVERPLPRVRGAPVSAVQPDAPPRGDHLPALWVRRWCCLPSLRRSRKAWRAGMSRLRTAPLPELRGNSRRERHRLRNMRRRTGAALLRVWRRGQSERRPLPSLRRTLRRGGIPLARGASTGREPQCVDRPASRRGLRFTLYVSLL